MSDKIESDYDTGWREGYEAASGAALAEAEDSTDEEIIDVLLPFQELRAEVERLRADWQLAVKIAEAHATEVERLRMALMRIVAGDDKTPNEIAVDALGGRALSRSKPS